MSDDLNTIIGGTYKSNKDKILGRLSKLKMTDPRLYEAFSMMCEDLDKVVVQLNPIQEVSQRSQAAQALPPPPSLFGYSFSQTTVNFNWLPYSPAGSTVFYELREGGTDWEDASFVLRTPSLGASINPLTVGDHTYRLKALNGLGDESATYLTLVVTVPAIGTPSVTAQVIDNNVLLKWTAPTSTFVIDHYEIYRDAAKQGETSGTFFTLFENVAGTYIYGIKAVDIAGNVSPMGQVEAYVNQPPDFELLTSFLCDLTAGSHSNTYYDSGWIYGPADLTETFETHFTSKSWADPAAQVAAGYDLYIQDNPSSGVWTSDEADIGATQNNVIVNVSLVTETLATTNAPTFSVEIRGGTTPGGGSFTPGASQFFTSVRYITVRVTITAAGSPIDDSMGRFQNLNVAVDVKREVDGNVKTCLASDTAGTVVLIPGSPPGASGNGTKTFRDVDSITLAPLESHNQAVTAIYDFTDAPNPTQFKILCFDSAGRRVDATVSWKIRGIV